MKDMITILFWSAVGIFASGVNGISHADTPFTDTDYSEAYNTMLQNGKLWGSISAIEAKISITWCDSTGMVLFAADNVNLKATESITPNRQNSFSDSEKYEITCTSADGTWEIIRAKYHPLKKDAPAGEHMAMLPALVASVISFPRTMHCRGDEERNKEFVKKYVDGIIRSGNPQVTESKGKGFSFQWSFSREQGSPLILKGSYRNGLFESFSSRVKETCFLIAARSM
jgi:hypothetical protein